MSKNERADRLAEALLADRAKTKSVRNDIVPCYSCGATFVDKGRQSELRFCSMRCQEWFDDGNPSYEQQREAERELFKVPLANLVIVAGPPGTVGRKPYAELFAAVYEARRERQRRRRKAA